jgi:hypothetical protein
MDWQQPAALAVVAAVVAWCLWRRRARRRDGCGACGGGPPKT